MQVSAAPAGAHRPTTLTTLQAGRAIASLLVVLFHAAAVVRLPKYWGDAGFGPIFRFGHAGVPFFFVLSGFIILWVHDRDIGAPARLPAYARRRFLRLYPVYWLALALVVAALFAGASGSGVPTPAAFAQSALLVGRPDASILPIGWTLFYEILFYAVFGILIVAGRAGLLVLAGWFALCLAPPVAGYVFAPINLLFGMGMLCALAVKRTAMPLPWALLGAGALLFFGAGIVETLVVRRELSPLVYGAGAALAIAGAAELERSGRLGTPSWLLLLGNASYSIYLVHFTLVSLAAKLLYRISSPGIGFVGMAAAGVAGGLLFHRVIERPLLAGRHALRRGVGAVGERPGVPG